ncbi:hypothetical protein TWF694_007372 [Orbilia ellipsospora]|uniref:Uncharacterized protein n=1 Tax=Orbilia ellipsospora TaxID=2528407 RepID=A0AAV9XHI9_9PEZI
MGVEWAYQVVPGVTLWRLRGRHAGYWSRILLKIEFSVKNNLSRYFSEDFERSNGIYGSEPYVAGEWLKLLVDPQPATKMLARQRRNIDKHEKMVPG